MIQRAVAGASLGLSAALRGRRADAPTAATTASERSASRCIVRASASAPHGKIEIDLAPVLLGGGALGGPVGRVIQLVGHLRRPVAADVAVEQIALDRLAQAGGAAGAVRFPAGREHQRAAERKVRLRRLLRRPALLQRHDIAPARSASLDPRAALRLIGLADAS